MASAQAFFLRVLSSHFLCVCVCVCVFPFFVQTLSFSEFTEYSERHILKRDHFC